MQAKYQILDRELDDDILQKEPLTPTGWVVHSTANPRKGAGDEMHFKWLNRERRHGWAHYYGDHDSISRLVSEGFIAPAQGETFNLKALSYEMCEPDLGLPYFKQLEMFQETWNRAVWTIADGCHRWGWTVDQVLNHADVSRMHPDETDHTDPLAFFQRYGKTWMDFKGDVHRSLEVFHMEHPPLGPNEGWKQEYIDTLMAKGLLSTRRHPNQPLLWWEYAAMMLKILKEVGK